MLSRLLAFGVALLACAPPAQAHGGASPDFREVAWGRTPAIARVVAADRISTITDHDDCLGGEPFYLDVDDEIAFDIDGNVDISLTLKSSGVADTISLRYDHAREPQTVTAKVRALTKTVTQHVSVSLPRARFANRLRAGTDLWISLARELRLCDVSLSVPASAPREIGHLKLSVRDNDGRPTTAQIGLFAADGKAALPSADALPLNEFGHIQRHSLLRFSEPGWRGPGRYVFYVEGHYDAELDVGSYELIIHKGPAFEVVRQRFEIATGEVVSLDEVLSLKVDFERRGWYSGDTHVHVARPGPWTNAALLKTMAARGLRVANLLQTSTLSTTGSKQFAFGSAGTADNGQVALVPGQEAPRTSIFGHAIGLRTKHFHDDRERYLLYGHTATAVRDGGGLFGLAHVAQDLFGVKNTIALEAPLGSIDFIEILQQNRLDTDTFYDLLNLGIRVLPSAGSDYPFIHTPGAERVWVKLRDTFSVDRWFHAWRYGRALVSNGPLIEFSVDGDADSAEVATRTERPIKINAQATMNPDLDRLTRLELVHNGEVVASGRGSAPELTLTHRLTPGASGWLAVRAYGAEFALAHTSALWLTGAHSTPGAVRTAAAKKYVERLKQLRNMSASAVANLHPAAQRKQIESLWQHSHAELTRRIDAAAETYEQLIAPKESHQPHD